MSARAIFNGLIFQTGWFVAILAAASGATLLATLAPLAVVAIYLVQVHDLRNALRLIAAAAVIGFIGETVLMTLGLTYYSAHMPLTSVAPIWVVALWMAFATLPNLALRWFRGHLVLTAVLGAIFGPLTYLGGENFGAGHMGEPYWLGITGVALMWAFAAPLLLWLGARWESEPIVATA